MKRIVVILVPIAVALVVYWLVFWWFPSRPPSATWGTRPECPRHEDYLLPDSLKPATTIPNSAQQDDITLIPEFHDCQRLISDGTKTAFGPLVAIFVRDHLGNLGDPPVQLPPPPPPPLPPFVVPGQPLVPGGVQGSDEAGTSRAVATILNYDSPYTPLSIASGFNCLYLYHATVLPQISGPVTTAPLQVAIQPRLAVGWHAKIFPVTNAADCLQPLPPTGGVDLLVTVGPPDPNPPPPVGRWDWDAGAGEHYVGIRCGTSWCEVYNKQRATAFTSSAKYAPGKGWYDEQYLAVDNAATPTELVPGSAMGTIVPVAVTADAWTTKGEWKQVANVSLSAESPVYANKLKFAPGPPPNGPTVVWLCRGSRADCLPWWVRLFGWLYVNSCNNAVAQWWAKMVSPLGTKYRCVVQRKHEGIDVPDVVRWRWRIDDDGIWRRCETGCCEVT